MPSEGISLCSESSIIYIFPIYFPIMGNTSPDLWAKSLKFEKKYIFHALLIFAFFFFFWQNNACPE